MTTERTGHGRDRHREESRPSEAVRDRQTAREIYFDLETGLFIFVGPRGRTHVFTADGRHHTSFRTTQANRWLRVKRDKWKPISHSGLPEELQ